MLTRTFVVTLMLLAATGQVLAQGEEIILHPLEVELLAGDWDYVPYRVAIGGVLFSGYGLPDLAVTFNVAGFDGFRALAGVKDGGGGTGGIMSVEVDGKPAWRQRVQPGQAAQRIEVALTGHRTLVLRSNNEQCVFAEPRLLHGGTTPEPGRAGAGVEPSGLRAEAKVIPAAGPLAGRTVYHNSFALLIGLNEYERVPQDSWLRYAVSDVNAMREMLIGSYGFAPENVLTLTNRGATLDAVRRALAMLSDERIVKPEDRVLVYFSGHGQTVKLSRGGEVGFLLPFDASLNGANVTNAGPFLASCLAMNSLWNILEASPAKHVLVLADACYSGLLTRGEPSAPTPAGADLAALSARRSMQVITAGRQGDVSTENAAFGHGAFTYKLLDALQASAATPGAVLTASQLHATVRASVVALTQGRQTPQIGSYDTEGDFLFVNVAPFAPLAKPTAPVKPVPPVQPVETGPTVPVGPTPGVATAPPADPPLPADPAQPVAGPGGHFYLAVAVTGGLGWAAAREAAQRQTFHGLQGHLVTLTSVEESRFVVATFPEAAEDSYWIGGYQDHQAPDYREPADGWRWVTGEPWRYTQWNNGLYQEPNNADGGEDVASFSSNGNWNDQRAISRLPGYVVEFDPAK